jgi:hypothetical protein
VRGANGRCWYAIPLRIVPARGKVTEHDGETARPEGGNVFDEDPRRPDFVDDSVELTPETAAPASDACAFACVADVLTWESAADEVDVVEAASGELSVAPV